MKEMVNRETGIVTIATRERSGEIVIIMIITPTIVSAEVSI